MKEIETSNRYIKTKSTNEKLVILICHAESLLRLLKGGN